MANIFEFKKRRVIPNWRTFCTTVSLGELNNSLAIKELPNLNIDSYIIDWNFDKSISKAGELLSAAIVNNYITNNSVIEAAQFILSNKQDSTLAQISLAKNILSLNNKKKEEELATDLLDIIIEKEPFYKKINQLKKNIIAFPRNAIAYVEIARLYSILGQNDKADFYLKNAISIAPDNRFILRAISRHFAKTDIGFAHDILRKSNLTNVDPWLTSTEIALATIRNRSSRFVKKGLNLINSNNFHPHILTELSSSIGTLELINGSFKSGKKLFNSSLISPNDNSLAQAEWASKEFGLSFYSSPIDFDIQNNYEAVAMDNFFQENWDMSFNNALLWFIDTPYAKRPIQLASHIASSITDNQEDAIKIIKAGLTSHPNDAELLNNIAYSLGLTNQIEEAEKYLNKISLNPDLTEKNKICLVATKGLILHRKGFHDAGRKLYLEAIKSAKDKDFQYLHSLAIVNFVREEILSGASNKTELLTMIENLPVKDKHVEINKIKENIIKLK
ncbi:MAG: hypothetical protein HN778_14830 [Prolixibacteraceae bacterium]|jgi:tetratricopeptide (TPR) repeat protein|nr:hypothetical protein [Prolixibacteraceae bacterium]MBT6763704.1 hypothetical protein [Prolixibacteraceae bacterium]MBT6997679.1 hypothetical protein [Prolixibacteraceae bacterium]MBT7396103.1 hypothetical protein [Prolixibacteraceae bacterium]